MNQIKYIVVIIAVIVIVTQAHFTSIFIDNQKLVYLISSLGYLAIFYPLYLIFVKLNGDLNEKNAILKEENETIKLQNEQLQSSTKNDFLFFEHLPKTPFHMISKSVNDILEVDEYEFRASYKRFKAEQLFDGSFKRAEESAKSGLKIPIREVELISKNEKKVVFEVKEYPVFDTDRNIVKVFGVAHNISMHSSETVSVDCTQTRFNALYENVNDGVLIMKKDRFVDCNTKILEIFGASLEQIIMYSPFSRKFSPSVQPNGKNSKEEALYRLNLAYEGEPQYFEWMHLRQNGQAFLASIHLYRFESQGEYFLFAILKDLTIERQLEAQIKEQKDLNRFIFEQSPIGIALFDQELKISKVNNALSQILSLDKNIENTYVDSLWWNSNLVELVELSKKEGTQLINITLEKDVPVKLQAKVVPFFDYETFKGGLILLEEMNEANALKQALNKEQANFEEIITNSKDVLYKYDLNENKYEYISDSIEDMFGYNATEFSNLNEGQLKSILHPRELYRANQILAKLSKGNVSDDSVLEYSVLHKDGTTKWIKDTYSVLKNEQSKPIAVLGIVTDLTTHKTKQYIIEEKEQLIRIITENIDQGITIIINNKIEFVNKKLIEITEYQPSFLNQQESLLMLATEIEKERIKDAYIKIVSGSYEIKELSFWITTGTGKHIFIKNEYHADKENPMNRFVLTTDQTQDILARYINDPDNVAFAEYKTYFKPYL